MLASAACSTTHPAATPAPADARSEAGNVAAEVQETDQPAANPQLATRDRIICKKVAPTGTRVANRTCLTLAQWEAIQADAKAALEKVQREGRLKDAPPGT
ncbi:MAG: hypothetical protein FJ171_04105 [Gammaproteobacteria bacterium]|nr:hypothetical protein [Gammaproteobacteria bacterium]